MFLTAKAVILLAVAFAAQCWHGKLDLLAVRASGGGLLGAESRVQISFCSWSKGPSFREFAFPWSEYLKLRLSLSSFGGLSV